MLSDDLSISVSDCALLQTNLLPQEERGDRFFNLFEKELEHKVLDIKRNNNDFLSKKDDLDDFIDNAIKIRKESISLLDRLYEEDLSLCFKRTAELYGNIVDIDSENRRFVALMSSDFDSNKRNVWFSFDEICESDSDKITKNRKIVYSSIKELVGGEQRNVVKVFFIDDAPLNTYQQNNIETIASRIFERVNLNGISDKSNRKKR